MTIDTYVTTNNITRVDLIKIDTEGTEHNVLEGAKNILERYEPVIVCEVLKDRTERFLHSILDDTRYKFFLISSEGLTYAEQIVGDATHQNRNYLFVTENRIPEILQGISIR